MERYQHTILMHGNWISDTHSVTLNKSKEGYYGLYFDYPMTPGFLYISALGAGSPAETSNELRVGDRVLAVNKHRITEKDDYESIINMIKHSGNKASLTLTVSHERGNI